MSERRARGWRRIAPWVLWPCVLAGLTVVMFGARETTGQAHVVLLYLLVVLGGSATGGRGLGLTLAAVSFALVDYYFQLPFDTLSVGKPLDWVVLVAFIATALVATQLLALANEEAVAARERATEIGSLARLGAEALRAGAAADALGRVAHTVATTLPVDRCAIFPWDPVAGIARGVTDRGEAISPDDPLLMQAARNRRPTARLAAGSFAEYPFIDAEHVADTVGSDPVRELALPLVVGERVLGVLELAAERGVRLEPASRRFLDALTYYAALALDRLRLAREAEQLEQEREANRVKDTVLASVSHDLRTPLTTIKALAEDAALRGDPNAAAIEEQADRLTRLVDDLLDLSRFRANAFSAAPELNIAEDLIGAARRQAHGLLQGRRLETHIDLSTPALVGRFDFVQTLRIIGNLIENAARYASPEHPIELTATQDGDHLKLTVADRGVGVPPEEAERIFDPFYRARNATADGHRSGLGLSIARRLAEIQGGTLTYAARPEGGSVFTLRLPGGDPASMETGEGDEITDAAQESL